MLNVLIRTLHSAQIIMNIKTFATLDLQVQEILSLSIFCQRNCINGQISNTALKYQISMQRHVYF